ncbi:hypothetical protein EDB19DRAFT_1832426 [Suillus lakei]|nr:hypothetical protein EDB19DRAFT_1832426 [Suillus lakei]
MEDDNSFNILEEILKSKILEWNPNGSTVLGTRGYMVNNTSEDGWNTDEDIGALSIAIDNCKMLDDGMNVLETHKQQRGRPRKPVVQHYRNQKPQVAINWKEASSQNVHNSLANRIIHAMTSPLPDELPSQAMSTVRNRDGMVQENKHPTWDKLRRPRGRPTKSAVTRRSKKKANISEDQESLIQDLQNHNVRYVIRATSNPVQQPPQAEERLDGDDDGTGIEHRDLSKKPVKKQRQGCPNRRVRHGQGAGRWYLNYYIHIDAHNQHHSIVHRESPVSPPESEDEDEEHIQEPCWSSAQSFRGLQDDEYRPSPYPPPEVQSPSHDTPQPTLPEQTVDEVALRAKGLNAVGCETYVTTAVGDAKMREGAMRMRSMRNVNAKCAGNYSGICDEVPRYKLAVVECFNAELAREDENSNQIAQGLERSN